VGFFSQNEQPLGDKATLDHRLLGLHFRLFKEGLCFEFTVNEQISWAADRHTIKVEDKVYSLLGNFEVHMPLIYGEG
jgi:hypothetical protein